MFCCCALIHEVVSIRTRRAAHRSALGNPQHNLVGTNSTQHGQVPCFTQMPLGVFLGQNVVPPGQKRSNGTSQFLFKERANHKCSMTNLPQRTFWASNGPTAELKWPGLNIAWTGSAFIPLHYSYLSLISAPQGLPHVYLTILCVGLSRSDSNHILRKMVYH